MSDGALTTSTLDNFIKVLKRRKILWELTLATVVGDGTRSPITAPIAAVTLDGDTAQVTASVLVPTIMTGSRVAVIYVNGGYYIIGTVDASGSAGLMNVPSIGSGSVGPTSGTTIMMDTGTPDFVFTGSSLRRYRAFLTANFGGSAAGDRFIAAIRDGGTASPTNASPTINGHDLPIEIGADTVGIVLATTFTVTDGIHTLNASYVRNSGTGTGTVSGAPRELYVEDIGPI